MRHELAAMAALAVAYVAPLSPVDAHVPKVEPIQLAEVATGKPGDNRQAVMTDGRISATEAEQRSPPAFGDHPFPSQNVVTRTVSDCGRETITVEVDQRLGAIASRSLKIWRGDKALPADDVRALEQASAGLPRISLVNVYCVGAGPVWIELSGPVAGAAITRANIVGLRLEDVR